MNEKHFMTLFGQNTNFPDSFPGSFCTMTALLPQFGWLKGLNNEEMLCWLEACNEVEAIINRLRNTPSPVQWHKTTVHQKITSFCDEQKLNGLIAEFVASQLDTIKQLKCCSILPKPYELWVYEDAKAFIDHVQMSRCMDAIYFVAKANRAGCRYWIFELPLT